MDFFKNRKNADGADVRSFQDKAKLTLKVMYRADNQDAAVDSNEKLEYLRRMIKAHLPGIRLDAEMHVIEEKVLRHRCAKWFG